MVYVHGNECYATSVNHDNQYLQAFCARNKHKRCRIEESKWIISVWWNTTKIDPSKKYIIYISNFVKLDNAKFAGMISSMNAHNNVTWLCPSTKQQKELASLKLNNRVCPFYVHDSFYKKPDLDHQEIFDQKILFFNEKSINASAALKILNEKIVVGSFQRDSLGSDLSQPKWQKGPENTIRAIKESKNKKDIVLLLCGSRRHYLIKECKKNNIDYIYLCNRPPKGDDISYNMFLQEEVYSLYKNIDLYFCGSVLEGGPKCIIESAHLDVPIFSHDIGLCSDYIEDDFIHTDFNGDSLDLFIKNIKNFKFKKNFPSIKYKDSTLNSIINEG